jgi:hypothetical protein
MTAFGYFGAAAECLQLAYSVCKDFPDESSGIDGAVRLKAAWQWLTAAVATSYEGTDCVFANGLVAQ